MQILCKLLKGHSQRVREIEKKLDEVQKGVKDNASEIEKVDRLVDQLRKDLDKVKEASKEEARNYVTAEEYREREARRLNVIMHRVPEPQAHTGEERKQADLAALKTIFSAIGLSEWAGAIKLCRRLGERGDEPQPLIVCQPSNYYCKFALLLLALLISLSHQ
jgi:chromosome segregation ATPase